MVGMVEGAMIKLTYGDDFAKVGYPTISMYPKNAPSRSGSIINFKVFYTETAPRTGFDIPLKIDQH